MSSISNPIRQAYSTAVTYQGNLDYHDGSHFDAVNATINPVYAVAIKGYEASTGLGASYHNAGDSLSTSERVISGVESAAATLSVVTLGYGGAKLSTSLVAARPPPLPVGSPRGFGGLVGESAAERTFLANARSTFRDGSVFSGAVRHRGNIVIQRSDIPLSIQNLRRMQGGNSPFVRNAAGEWESLNLHHIGRRDGQLIEVLASHNAYNPVTGGPLHIPSIGGPIRQSGLSRTYWQQRFDDFISSGRVSPDLMRQLGR
jgi:hypothetical protein